jgi:L-aminopeptidase/D-esterase-like protein
VAPDSREFAGAARIMRERFTSGSFSPRNTTLAVLATNARLTKVQAAHVSRVAQHGFVRAISPVHTMMDGDLAITLSCGAVEAPLDLIGVLAADAVAQAIVRAARLARSLGGVPGLASS